ncbi:MAG: polyphosphate kinase 1 [Spirochaetaceae bacterium]|jgi:polyphosphate kinase|nr:polyphosphate kinase 1 [Spirochaetaceae bacterium]
MMEDIKQNEAGPDRQLPPGRFFNRDLSWIDFNARVLEEGLRPDLPPLDRFRFLSIVSSNFDEFFMVRVAGLKRARRAGTDPDPSGLSWEDQLKTVTEKVRALMRRLYDCLENEVIPALARGGLELVRPDTYSLAQMDRLEDLFVRELYPALTPLRLTGAGELPFMGNQSIYAAFLLVPDAAFDDTAGGGGRAPGDTPDAAVPAADAPDAAGTAALSGEAPAEYISLVRIPPTPDRLIRLPDGGDGRIRLALVEDVVLTWGAYLFPGYTVKENMLFTVNRDADFSVDERRDEDFIEAMEEVIQGRDHSRAVRMVFSADSPRLRDELARRLELEEGDLYEVRGPPDLAGLGELVELPGFDRLRLAPRKRYRNAAFAGDESLWDRISGRDVLLHLPYQSFDPVVRFFRDAAVDPQVIAIKTALYRTSGDSPIINALEEAALNGKHITAVVELKARFDEERNISWANRLERAGVIVIYGLARLKVHAKVSLVVRREQDGIKRYVHLSTGNYNDRTAKQYEDLCLFTAREDIAFDAGLIFNMITGYSAITPLRKLVIAPTALKRRLIELIGREAKRSGPENPGRIMAKMNALADTDVIDALYRASLAGVQIYLQVRGVCMLKPGLPGLSENIRVISIVDRYLEHSRIYYFANAGAEEFYLSSADWMPRNLERRIELMFPVQEESIREELRDTLEAGFRDNCQAHALSGGNWTRSSPAAGEAPFRAQEYLLSRAQEKAENPHAPKQEFIVRRAPPGLGIAINPDP